MEKPEINLIKFNGKNYPSWAFQFELYQEGKELWGHIFGTDPKPTKDEKKIVSWNTKDAKIKTWILGFMEPHLFLNLKPYKTAKVMWEYLKKVYHYFPVFPAFAFQYISLVLFTFINESSH